MKKRIFYATLLLILFFFNGSILFLSLITLKDNYDAVRDRCLAEHFVIASALINDIQALEGRGIDVQESIEEIMLPYTRFSQNKTMKLAVSKDTDWIYHNLPEHVELTKSDLLTRIPDESSARTVFTENNPSPVLYVYGRFPAPFNAYGLLYQYDLGEMLPSWRKTKNMMFTGGSLVMIILSFCLLYLLALLFRPLKQISEASLEIAGGHYDKRLLLSGRDEIAVMAGSFNQMAREIEKRMEELEEGARQKQQFIDNFAHEMRTPMTAVYGYAEYIQKAAISDEDKYEATQFIMSQCRRLESIAEQMLSLATLRREAIPMRDCPVQELFTASRSTMESRAMDRNIQLTYNNRLHTVTGSPELMSVLLNNLIDNALHASPDGGEVKILAYYRNGCQLITVSDSGIGMTKEQLSHITEAFYRVDKARSRKRGGAGLGLSICSRIASIHNARLEFTSQPGKGTTASIIFTTP